MYLDDCTCLEAQVGYGEPGMRGSLGYENKIVTVQGVHYTRSVSSHPPARLRFHVGGRYASFHAQVAINDDVPAGRSHADFIVLADGREVIVDSRVQAGSPPRSLVANILGSQYIELVVQASRWEYAHAVWLDPRVEESPAPNVAFYDCLKRCEIMLPAVPLRARKCIATLVSSGYENLLDDMLGSLYANGNCQDALLVVFLIDGSEECERIAKKYNASIIRCRAHSRINAMSKALLYSVAKIVNAEQFLCLDADMLVLNDLSPVFSMIEACPPGKILACYEGNAYGFHNLDHAFRTVYGGLNAEKNRLQITSKEDSYPLVVNDGLFAGGRNAMLALDDVIRDMANAPAWADGNKNIWWRNQYIFNLALARLDCGVELDASYNIQLHSQDVTLSEEGARIQADWHGRLARVLHFNGIAKQKYPEWQGRYAKVLEPMVGRGGGDGYAVFLEAIRNWVGLHGMKGLAWSFYGLTDGTNGKVNDPSVLPLFANLYYLIRANGCVRVLETGTARGVSAACLATAVGHRQGGCVVTIDPYDHPGRQQLWMTLPETYRNCIQPRLVDSFTGMQSAIDQGERYDAVLLDSVHTEEHVWTEFQLALQLVCRGGLIIIHDALYANGTVDAALRRIQTAGYNVVRLLSAECGVAEDDHLGLAVIENRLRETAIK